MIRNTEKKIQGESPSDLTYQELFGTLALTRQRREVWIEYYAKGMRKPGYADLKARALRAGASASRQLGGGGQDR